MKKIFVMFAMSALALTSCLQEDNPVVDNNGENDAFEPSGELVEKVFTVGEIKSKTYIDGTVEEGTGDLVIKWCADDAISVWDGVANRKFTMVGEPDGASATFKGYVDAAATEFFAFYPYDEALAHKVASSKHVFSFPKSNIQYANPEGGLADGAAFACAKVEDNVINFASNSCMLKFSLAEGMEVKSITIKGNETDDILAGTTNFTYDGTRFSPGFEQSVEKFTELTLCNQDGSNLKTGTDYYLAMQGNEYKAGYTISLALADGTVYSKSSSKAIQYQSGSIYPLSAKPLSHGMFDYYKGYLAGEDIVIAGKAYNKATYGNATLIAKGQTATISTNGVYFIEDGAVVDYNPTNSLSKMIIVGRDPSVRSPMIQKIHYKMATNGVLAVMNLAIDSQLGSNYLFNIYSSNTPKSYAVDNCSMKFTNKNFLYQAKATWVSEVQFHNCDIEFTYSANNDIWLFNVDSATPSVELFDFQNNVFWHSGTMAAGKAFRITNGEGLAIGKLIFRNNTFINLPTRDTRTSYIGSTVSSGEVSGNLIYLPTQSVNASMLHSSSTGVTYGTNYYYTGTDVTFSPFTAAEGDPFTTCDVTTGTFVKAAAYENYGAKR